MAPSGITQAEGPPAEEGIMKNALSRPGWPPFSAATYNSMFEQLECHLLWRVKTPYDLDSWRPPAGRLTVTYSAEGLVTAQR
jgi:hypothetical protein